MSARILHITYSGAGGAGEVAVELARHADRRRFRPAVCFFGREPESGEPVAPSFRARLDAAGVEWSHVALGGSAGSLWRLFRECTRLRPDVAVAHGATNALVLPLLRIARRSVRCIAVFHGPPSLAATPAGIARWLPGLGAAHRVVSVAPHLARLLGRNVRCDSLVIPNGIWMAGSSTCRGGFGAARSEPAYPATPELVMVATLSPSKDHRSLLDAAARLAAAKVCFRLVLAGDGILRRSLESRVEELGLAGRVQFAGCLTAEDTARLVAGANIFVYATHEEGCPLAVLEAMAAARPIVASRVPGIEGLLEDRRTALLVAPHDPAALAAAVQELLASPEFAIRLGAVAHETVADRYSFAACLRGYEDLFDSLLDPRVAAPSPMAPRREAAGAAHAPR